MKISNINDFICKPTEILEWQEIAEDRGSWKFDGDASLRQVNIY